jgi:pyruvate dehydrogenase E2 component (dihydrolipoamide acetyltransferase)
MTILIRMPALSPTMTEGRLVGWLVKEGDLVSPGTALFEIETDKAVMEVESVDDGIVGKILVEENSGGILVNSIVAVLLEEGESASEIEMVLKDALVNSKEVLAQEILCEQSDSLRGSVGVGAIEDKKDKSFSSGNTMDEGSWEIKTSDKRILASPLAKRLARQHGVRLEDGVICGSGPRGRIVMADITDFMDRTDHKENFATSKNIEKGFGKSELSCKSSKEITLSPMRKVIAQRLWESKQRAPHFYLTVHCRVDALLALRDQVNASFKNPEGVGSAEGKKEKLSVTHWFLKASSLAMAAVPEANAIWNDGSGQQGPFITQFSSIDLAVAVAIEGGLVTPVLRQTEDKNLRELARDFDRLVALARQGRLSIEDMSGGAMTLSNLGMYGIDHFSAIINPPQSSILAIGAVQQVPYVVEADRGFDGKKDGCYCGQKSLKMAQQITLTLSVDHRVLDGAVAARFLKAIQDNLENPLNILI